MRSQRFVCAVIAAGTMTSMACDKTSDRPPSPSASASSGALRTKITPEQRILDAAIKAAGGLAKLEAAKSMKSKYKTVFPNGAEERGELAYKPGKARLDVTMKSGRSLTLITGRDRCLWKEGPVVLQCGPERKQWVTWYHAMYEATRLWPLKQPGWELRAGKKKIKGKALDTLTVKKPKVGVEGVLYFDPATHLLARFSYVIKRDGKPVEWATTLSEHKKFCGIMLPAREQNSLGGRPLHSEEVSEVRCEPIADDFFKTPKQVVDGAVVERKLGVATLACHTAKASYSDLPRLQEELSEFVTKKNLRPSQGAMRIEFAAPPRKNIENPKLSRVCLEVIANPPDEPKVDGDFVITKSDALSVLSKFGLKADDEKSRGLATELLAEAKKRKLKTTGPVREIVYRDRTSPGSVAPVREIQIAIKPES